MVECSFLNKVIVGLSPIAVNYFLAAPKKDIMIILPGHRVSFFHAFSL